MNLSRANELAMRAVRTALSKPVPDSERALSVGLDRAIDDAARQLADEADTRRAVDDMQAGKVATNPYQPAKTRRCPTCGGSGIVLASFDQAQRIARAIVEPLEDVARPGLILGPGGDFTRAYLTTPNPGVLP